MTDLVPVTAGFIPLLDSAVLIAAVQKGFAEKEGIALKPVRETSWANIRDRVAVGHFDVAHMLAPMPIAASLGLTSLAAPMIAPMALGLGGNAVTVSTALWQAMEEAGARAGADPVTSGAALATVIAGMASDGNRLRFAVVHPHSSHNYELRYWLAASKVHPDRDIDITIVPPPFMGDALAAGQIDGYCVGEPWNTLVVRAGAGRIATVKAAIWRSSPEKVLGVRERWAASNPDTLAALLRALHAASLWCDTPDNHPELAAILSHRDFLDRPAAVIRAVLGGKVAAGGGTTLSIDDFIVFARRAATFPWQSHALWFYSQMVRWGQVRHTANHAARARATYRPDLYRDALRDTGAALPRASAKVEGALAAELPVASSAGRLVLGPDGFFDGAVFDPDDLDSYLAGFVIRAEPAP